MKNELISVIIPCYNVSKFVRKCLDSVINQTYKNLEIILVEDCGTDNTYEILKEYEEKDSRIKIIKNKKNSGLSYSRNIGIKNSTGKYIGFIDSDDYIDLDFYEKMIASINRDKSELAVCDIKIVYDDTKAELISKAYSDSEFNLLNVINNGLAASACNKLFKRELITKYFFAEGKVNEDIAVVIPALVNANKISYADNVYYYYIQRKGSIQNSGFSDKRFDIIDGVDLTLERIKGVKDYDELRDALIFNQIIVLLLYAIPKEKNKKHRKIILKKYNELTDKYDIRQNRFLWNFLRDCGKKHRIYYKLLFKLNCEKHYFLANNLISMYDFLYKILKKQIIENNIDLNKVIEKAKYQSKLKDEKIKVSVIIPNYNYERFMHQRVYSILNQDFKIHELIILDDKSSDNSIKVIDEMVENIKDYINIKTVYNEKNSGSAFKQWKKGFEHATGDYIWIAEADDYCDKSFLKTVAKPCLKDENIVISYTDTAFIDTFGNILIKSIKSEIDIQKSKHWDKSYINNGLDEIKKYSFLNNTIANVSSCLIKTGNYEKYLDEATQFKQAGDWIFYTSVISNGKISYINKPLNYYRVHGNNVSSTTAHEKHLDELNRIYEKYDEKYNLNDIQKEKINDRIKFLKNVWKIK